MRRLNAGDGAVVAQRPRTYEYPSDDAGLILASRVGPNSDDRRVLIREVERGELVRLRRGAYVTAAQWTDSNPRERHLLRIRAAVAASERPLVLARESAAAIWGMPLGGDFPDEVTTLVQWPGGGSTEAGIKRTADGFHSAIIGRVGEFSVTSLERTALDVARFESFRDAVGSVDWAISRKTAGATTREALAEELRRWHPRVGARHLRHVVSFASPLSDSFGESRARAAISQLGFALPVQQAEFRDEEGSMFTDFFWPSVNVVAEFDGKVKYTSEEFTGGDPAEVVWREKQREDRLRRQVATVVRIISSDLAHPERLERLLLAAKVPRGGGYGLADGRARPSAR